MLGSKYFLRQFKDVIKLNRRCSYEKSFKCVSARRFIHTSGYFTAPVFKTNENVYAYSILKSIPLKNSFVYTDSNSTISSEVELNDRLDQYWRSKSANEIVDCFKSVLNYCVDNNIDVSDRRFDKLVDGLMDHVQDLTDENLSDLLVCIAKFPPCNSYTAHNFHDIWSALDDACCWKLPKWSTETMFAFADHWYQLNLGKFSDYLFWFIDRVFRKYKFLPKDEIVHSFFYLKLNKRQTLPFVCQTVIDKYVNDMNIDEIAVAAIMFGKKEVKIKSESTTRIMINKLKQALPVASDICISNVVHVLRYSSHALLVDQLMDLLDGLVPEIQRLSNICCIHIALLGTTLQFSHAESLEKVTEKILADISKVEAVRLKDIERLLLPLTMFNVKTSASTNLFDAVYDEIHKEERRKEFIQFRRCLPSILKSLSMQKTYSYQLMNEILDMDYVVERYGKSPKLLPHEIFSLDVCIDVECPDYRGNRLDKQYRRNAAKWHVEYTPTRDQFKKITMADQFVLDVTDTVAKIVNGRNNLRSEHVLPNIVKSDIIICSENGNFVPPTGFENYELGDVMRPPNSDLTRYAIVTVNWNMCIRNTSIPLGLINMKCRMLKTIGYKPILVIWNEYMPLSEEDKISYIKNKIH